MSNAPAGRKGRSARGRPSAERVAEIDDTVLKVATSLFLRDGYEGTSMEAVAEQAGIQRKTLYRRYGDKSALLGGVLESRRAAWTAASAQYAEPDTQDLKQRLKHHVGITLAWASTEEIRTFLRISNVALAHTGGRFRRDELFGFDLMVERMASDIRRLGPAQGFESRDANAVAITLMAMIAGWIELRPASRLSEKESAERAAYFVDLVIRGKDAW